MGKGNKIVYSTTTLDTIDEYTSEYLNKDSLCKLGLQDNLKVGVSPVPTVVKHKTKYPDANWMP